MAEVARVLSEMQLDTEGGLVPRRRSKHAKDDSAAVGAAKADRKMAVAKNKAPGASGTGMVKAASWSDFGICGTETAAGTDPEPKEERKAVTDLEPKEERKAEPAVAITKVTVPEAYIQALKKCPPRRPRPLPKCDLANEDIVTWHAQRHAFADLEEDCLRQHAKKGYAEVGVKFINGLREIFPLGN